MLQQEQKGNRSERPAKNVERSLANICPIEYKD